MPATLEQSLSLDVIIKQTGLEAPRYPGADHIVPRAGLYSLLRRPVFQVGEWNDEPWPKQKVDKLISSFRPLLVPLHPWVTINHERPAKAEQRVDDPDALVKVATKEGLRAFLGFISDFYYNTIPYMTSDGRLVEPGHLALADFVNVAPDLAIAVSRGNFLRASIGVLDNVKVQGPGGEELYEHAIEHISFEGEWEAVHTLGDLNRWYFASEHTAQNFEGPREFHSPGPARIFTLSKGEVMEPKDTPGAPPAPPADPKNPADIGTRVQNIETVLAQVVQGQAAMNQSLAKLVEAVEAKKEGDEKPGEKPAAEAAAKKPEEEDQMANKDTKTSTETPATPPTPPAPPANPPATPPPPPAPPVTPTPPATSPPASQFSARDIERMRSEIRAEIERQIQPQVQAQAAELAAIKARQQENVREFKRKEVDRFVQDHRDRISPMLQPVLKHMLEVADEVDESAGTSVRKFHRLGSDGKVSEELGLGKMIRLYAANQPPLQLGTPVLKDLLAPPSTDTRQEWNNETCATAVREFQAKHPGTTWSQASNKLAEIHGPAFLNGTGAQSQKN